MLNSVKQNGIIEDLDLLDAGENQLTIKRIYDKFGALSMIQVLNSNDEILKCMFYDENQRLTNMSLYNVKTGKEIKNITYRKDGRTISSIREYNQETAKPLVTIFYKEDGKTISSKVKFDDQGQEATFSLYLDNGEIEVHNL